MTFPAPRFPTAAVWLVLLMFSLDGGGTWPSHHLISDRVALNDASIREVRPGRLLFVHDAPRLSAMDLDVERRK